MILQAEDIFKSYMPFSSALRSTGKEKPFQIAVPAALTQKVIISH